MRPQFSLIPSHLSFAHSLWQKLVQIGDTVVDATCGNGHDALVLAQLTLSDTQGRLVCFDVQEAALVATKKRLREALSAEQFSRIQFVYGCHSRFELETKAKLVVYNLGYLPGGDKRNTTHHITTLQSIEEALRHLGPGGAISITCYPGHAEGEVEEAEVMRFVKKLDPKEWNVTSHRWLNRNTHPHLILVEKKEAPVSHRQVDSQE